MLIIAAPKTISTSIMFGLAKILGVYGKQEKDLKETYGFIEDYDLLPHSDMTNVPRDRIERWIKSFDVYKQHLIPTEVHAKHLEEVGGRVVVLLRDPRGIYEAYGRSHEGMPVLFEKNKDRVQSQIRQYCDNAKRYFVSSNNVQYLFVTYDEIVQDNARVVNQILEFWQAGPRVLSSYKLPKYRYTRGKGDSEK